MKFSDFLFESEQIKTKEEIASAVNRFSKLDNSKKPNQARIILRAAEKIGYIIKQEEILKYSNKKVDVTQDKTKTTVEPTKDNSTVLKTNIDQPIKKDIKDNVFFQKYNKMKLDRYPDPLIAEEDVQEFPDNVGVGPILRWKDPKSGEWLRAYEPTFLEKNAQYKWDRIKSITEKDIKKIDEGSLELLKSKDENDRDAGAIIRMILLTGLRPGDRSLKTGTDNRGISSLKPDSVVIDGDKISLDFIGKSTKQNLSELEDKDIAEYLTYKIKKNKGKDFLFDISKDTLDTYFHKIAKKNMKIKDLRTYKANEIAKKVLYDNDIPPLPVPEKSSEIKKVVENKLKIVFDVVSKQLNNTPAMSKASYVIPETITNWLTKIGIKEVNLKDKKYINESINKYDEKFLNNADECETYNLPDWFDNNNFILIKKI